MRETTSCPECGRNNLYSSVEVASASGDGLSFLPGLGGFLVSAKFTLVMCRDCGLTRFYASPEARAKLSETSKWKKL